MYMICIEKLHFTFCGLNMANFLLSCIEKYGYMWAFVECNLYGVRERNDIIKGSNYLTSQ